MSEHKLKFHYRLAPEICATADRIMISQSGASLASTCLYKGPKPGSVDPIGPKMRPHQVALAIVNLKDQLRVYADFIAAGDFLGVIVPRNLDRETILDLFEEDNELSGLSQILRSRSSDETGDYNPEIELGKPIIIVTVAGCKGLEFRAVHWLFCDDDNHYFTSEHYYTVLTRAKTSVRLYHRGGLPPALASAYVPPAEEW